MNQTDQRYLRFSVSPFLSRSRAFTPVVYRTLITRLAIMDRPIVSLKILFSGATLCTLLFALCAMPHAYLRPGRRYSSSKPALGGRVEK
ncbi:hypothetical protein IBX73_10635 [candidate division WOR-3 bacterium]|nr:hypothetical protein [candidate division WOR-3 bacterium]